MADILKITSPVSLHHKIENIPKHLPADEIFDFSNHNTIVNQKIKVENHGAQGAKQTLLHELNRQLFAPLLNSTSVQADTLSKLMAMATLLRTSFGSVSDQLLDAVFIQPQELLQVLLDKEAGATVFKGEFFDTLRMLAKLEGQPRVREAVLAILKYFDCYVHQDQTLKVIVKQSRHLADKLMKGDGELLRQGADQLENLRLEQRDPKEMRTYLKNELTPMLGSLVKKYQVSERVHNPAVAIVHQVVRYDKGDKSQLEAAFRDLGIEMKHLAGLKEDEIAVMRQQLMVAAKEAKAKSEGANPEKQLSAQITAVSEEESLPRLISRALESDVPPKLTGLAQNLLLHMVQQESPLFSLMHFLVPLRFQGEEIYGEFFVDKNCQERKGAAESARTIFFTIRSVHYGNFEVDLLERERNIDLDIRCPDVMVDVLKMMRTQIREMITAQGYRLHNYEIGVYEESQSILHHFSQLAKGKVGFDVKI